MKNPELEAELSQILECLPYSKDIWADSWRVREILAELGVLSGVSNMKIWPKSLNLEELENKIGEKVYILCVKNRAYDLFDKITGVNRNARTLYLVHSSAKSDYGTSWLAYDIEGVKALSILDPDRIPRF